MDMESALQQFNKNHNVIPHFSKNVVHLKYSFYVTLRESESDKTSQDVLRESIPKMAIFLNSFRFDDTEVLILDNFLKMVGGGSIITVTASLPAIQALHERLTNV